MSSNSPDSHKISLKLIEAIKQHPVLYISEVKGYSIKLQEFRQKVWKRISNELGLDATWVKLKWKNLRDTYCRISKYKNKSSKGIRKKRWIFEDDLSFLNDPSNNKSQYVELTEEYVNDINTEVISSEDLLEQLKENLEDDDYSEYLEVVEDNTSSEETSVPQVLENNHNNNNDTLENDSESNDNQSSEYLAIDISTKSSPTKYRKIKPKIMKIEHNDIIDNGSSSVSANTPLTAALFKKPTNQNLLYADKIIDLPSQKKSFDYNSSIDDFFHNIAQNVKKLPLKIQADIKMDICKIVSEAEINHLQKNTPQRMQKYTNMPGMIQKLILVPCHMIDNQVKTDHS